MLPLKKSFNWLCHQRKNASPNSDIWDLRLNIQTLLPQIAFQISAGTYTLSPVKKITIQGKQTSLWTSKDSLVLKTISLILQMLPTAALKNLHHPFLMRSDVKSYYASIDHHILFNQDKDCSVFKTRRLLFQICINSGAGCGSNSLIVKN